MAARHDFYLTLPSDSNPQNLTGNYSVRLPYQLNLPGYWEAALTDILYPFSWRSLTDTPEPENLTGRENCIYILTAHGHMYKGYVYPMYYETIDILCDELMNCIFKAIIQTEIGSEQYKNLPLDYDEKIRRVIINIKTDIIHQIRLSKRLQFMLGFETAFIKNENNIAPFPPDLHVGTEALWIYCNLIENQVIGNTTGQLLKIVHVNGKFGEYIEQSYTNPHYLPILSKKIDQVKIIIRERTGKITPFQFGSIVVKLHIRRKRFLQ